LRINPEKCDYFCKKVVFLGHLVSHGEIRIDPEKISGIRDMEGPYDVKSLQRALGIFGYCRKFILNYSSLTAPLTDLRKDRPWVWGRAQQESFERLKELLTSSPVLAQPDYGKDFELETDASDYGFGAMLGQRDEKGFLRPVSFISRKLSPAEKNYSTRKRGSRSSVVHRKAVSLSLGTTLYGVHRPQEPYLVKDCHGGFRASYQMGSKAL